MPTNDELLEATVNAMEAAKNPQFSKTSEFAATDVLKVTVKLTEGRAREIQIRLEGGFEKFLAAAIAEQQ